MTSDSTNQLSKCCFRLRSGRKFKLKPKRRWRHLSPVVGCAYGEKKKQRSCSRRHVPWQCVDVQSAFRCMLRVWCCLLSVAISSNTASSPTHLIPFGTFPKPFGPTHSHSHTHTVIERPETLKSYFRSTLYTACQRAEYTAV